MANINSRDGKIIAKFLDNNWPVTGYLLQFSDSTFKSFFDKELNIDINDKKYDKFGTSKGKRLRAFFELEDEKTIGNTILKLADYCIEHEFKANFDELENFKNLGYRLLGNTSAIHVEKVITPIDDNEYWQNLVNSIHTAADSGQFNVSLDRLHTYMIAYFKSLLDKRKIDYEKEVKIEKLYGLVRTNILEQQTNITEMTKMILKSQTSVIQAFNQIRNDHSYAHPNPLLNKIESEFIVLHLISVKKFIDSILGINKVS